MSGGNGPRTPEERDFKARQLALLKFQNVSDLKACQALGISIAHARALKATDAYKDEQEAVVRECHDEAKKHCLAQAKDVAKLAMDVLRDKLKEGDLRAAELALKLVVKLDDGDKGPVNNAITIHLPGGLTPPDPKDVLSTIVEEEN